MASNAPGNTGKDRGDARAGAKTAASKARVAPRLDSYQRALEWLMARADVEKMQQSRALADHLKLARMKRLCELLGHPERGFKSVHVAGTKGKGSTCAMIASALQGCGCTVGLYTSPHLVDVRERIQVNASLISEADFVLAAQTVAHAEAKLEIDEGPDGAGGEPTYFEIITAMAFVHFARLAVDVGVIEVGLGGRLDSTNVITPSVCAVASISRDHWQILGDTLELIAGEKAGIFKPGVPAVAMNQRPSVVNVFREVAGRVGAPLTVVRTGPGEIAGDEIEYSTRFEATAQERSHHFVSLMTPRFTFEHIQVPLRGEHQAGNLALALAAIDALASATAHDAPRLPITEAGVAEGLARCAFPGRMELINTRPRMLLDGAHNADSIRVLMKSIGAEVRADSMVVIFACSKDKDIPGMLKELALGADKVIFTRASTPRGADPAELARAFAAHAEKAPQVADNFAHAVELAKLAVRREDLVCVTGSLYLVGDAKKWLQERGLGASRG